VTLWGNDPIWASGFVPGTAPALAHFPLARTAPDPTGAWLPPNAPADESDQRPGPFVVSSLPTSGMQARGGRVDVAPHDRVVDDYEGETLAEKRTRTSRWPLTLLELEYDVDLQIGAVEIVEQERARERPVCRRRQRGFRVRLVQSAGGASAQAARAAACPRTAPP
jgi:hypothetical protein